MSNLLRDVTTPPIYVMISAVVDAITMPLSFDLQVNEMSFVVTDSGGGEERFRLTLVPGVNGLLLSFPEQDARLVVHDPRLNQGVLTYEEAE